MGRRQEAEQRWWNGELCSSSPARPPEEAGDALQDSPEPLQGLEEQCQGSPSRRELLNQGGVFQLKSTASKVGNINSSEQTLVSG